MYNHISIDAGHNAPPDTGATGFHQEDVLTKELALKLQDLLFQNKINSTVVTPFGKSFKTVTNSLANRVNKANSLNSDLYISIHFNAFDGNANGVEVLTVSQKDLSQRIVDNISNLGFKNRGVKDGSNLYVINNTSMPSLLIECCFIDNKHDMDLYNVDKMANAILQAIINTKPSQINPVKPNINNNIINNDIKSIQADLVTLKIKDYNGKSLIIDGMNGDKTISAIKRFQSIMGLSVDGIAGNNTKKMINLILSKPLLQYGNTNPVIRYIQYRIGCDIDGMFGNKTLIHVKQFQKVNNLTADGIIGRNTYNKLFN